MGTYSYIEKSFLVNNGEVRIPMADVGWRFCRVIFIIIDKADGNHNILRNRNATACLNNQTYQLTYEGVQDGDQIRLQALIEDADIIRSMIDGVDHILFPPQIDFPISDRCD
ncbi:hypothetical protein [Leptospira licerasiae]|uniref:hypothetical protein n=1 Tax=Leptospira licerasiae TaxID=447106 RepID=UPI0011124CFD|nr:hypothetical protein [Leptospira licerasiae]